MRDPSHHSSPASCRANPNPRNHLLRNCNIRGLEKAPPLTPHIASVLASSCTYPLSVWVIAEDYSPLKLWCAATAIAAYMLGATLYVRSLIRGAGDTRMFVVCIAWHLATLVAGLIGVVIHVIPLWSLIAFTVLSMRAIIVPALQNSSRIKLRPAVIGIGEYLACVLMFSAVMAIVA